MWPFHKWECSLRMVLYSTICISLFSTTAPGQRQSVSVLSSPLHPKSQSYTNTVVLVQTLLVPALPANEQFTYPTSLTLENAYPGTATSLPSLPTNAPSNPSLQSASYNESLIGDVDIAQVFVNNPTSLSYTLFGFWVNGTNLAAYTTKNIGLSTQPKSSFPYSRLAGALDGTSSNILLYHQINGTSWAEDSYNLDGGFFTTGYFQIATS